MTPAAPAPFWFENVISFTPLPLVVSPGTDSEQMEALGARWEPQLGSWVLDHFSPWVDTTPVAQWMPSHVSSYFYLAQSMTSCWKCKKTIPVVAVLLPPETLGWNQDDQTWSYSNVPVWASQLSRVTKGTAKLLAAKAPNLRLAYAKMSNSTYYANHCPDCGALQGQYFLFQEPGGAFFPVSREQAQRISLKRISQPFVAAGACGEIPETNFWDCFQLEFRSSSDLNKSTSNQVHIPTSDPFGVDFVHPEHDIFLKPCPFCDGEAGFYNEPQGNFRDGITEPFNAWLVGCISNQCCVHVDTEGDETPEEAAEKWNSRSQRVNEALRKLQEGLDALGYMEDLRPEFHEVCLALGLNEQANAVCRLFHFPDTNQIVAATSLKQILESSYYVEFHSRIRNRQFKILAWDDVLHDTMRDGTKRTYTCADLVPGGTSLPELVWSPVPLGYASGQTKK